MIRDYAENIVIRKVASLKDKYAVEDTSIGMIGMIDNENTAEKFAFAQDEMSSFSDMLSSTALRSIASFIEQLENTEQDK